MLIIEYEKKANKSVKKLIDDAISFAFCELMPRIKRPVYLNIIPDRNLANNIGVYGDCLYEDDREFTLRIDTKLSPTEIAKTVIHEMVHVRQYLQGKFARWEKEGYDFDMDYESRPWEIEAHQTDAILMEKWNVR